MNAELKRLVCNLVVEYDMTRTQAIAVALVDHFKMSQGQAAKELGITPQGFRKNYETGRKKMEVE